MTTVYYDRPDGDELTVDLRDPRLAAILAWLWPGAGHFYQRRFLKGFLFMICIMGTFIYGMLLGQGRVVYASFRPNDFRWQYICQSGIGTPAMFAFLQKLKTEGDADPFFVLAERFPENHNKAFEIIPEGTEFDGKTIKDGFMAPPYVVDNPNENDALGMWHSSMKQRYDIGTIFTLLAGLLNMLAIYDAFAGPLLGGDSRKRKRDEPVNDSDPVEVEGVVKKKKVKAGGNDRVGDKGDGSPADRKAGAKATNAGSAQNRKKRRK